RRLRRAENTPVVQSDRQGVIAAIVREGGGKSSVVGGGSGGKGGVELVVWMPVLEGGVRKRAVQTGSLLDKATRLRARPVRSTENRIRLDALQCVLVNIKAIVHKITEDNAMSLKGKDVTVETSSSLRSEKVRSCYRQMRQQLEQPVYCESESRRPTTVEDDKQDISGTNPEKIKSTTQDLFELLERVQSSRLDDQRCVLPSYFSQVCHKIRICTEVHKYVCK
ncbi:hypothetical protein ALC53_07738, partial [Atta colombica]